MLGVMRETKKSTFVFDTIKPKRRTVGCSILEFVTVHKLP
jgi:hypothetical protein